MIESPSVARRARPRRWRRWFAGGAAALVVALTAQVLVALPACSCTSPSDVTVLNYSHQDLSVRWQAAGLLGTPVLGVSGRTTAPACWLEPIELHAGSVELILSAGAAGRTFQLSVAEHDRGSLSKVIVVAEDGTIGDAEPGPPAGGYPENPLCH